MQYINHIGYCGRDNSESLAHYGVPGMKWNPNKRKYNSDEAREDHWEKMRQMSSRYDRAVISDAGRSASQKNPLVRNGQQMANPRANISSNVANTINRKNPLIKNRKSSDVKTNIANSAARMAMQKNQVSNNKSTPEIKKRMLASATNAATKVHASAPKPTKQHINPRNVVKSSVNAQRMSSAKAMSSAHSPNKVTKGQQAASLNAKARMDALKRSANQAHTRRLQDVKAAKEAKDLEELKKRKQMGKRYSRWGEGLSRDIKRKLR